jgi:hypothetical protein
VIGFAAGGIGLSAIGLGLAFGVTAAGRNDDAKSLCPENRCPSVATKDEASATLASSDRAATVANVLVGAGALVLAAGVVLVLTGLEPSPRTKTAFLRPALAPLDGGGALFLTGSLR